MDLSSLTAAVDAALTTGTPELLSAWLQAAAQRTDAPLPGTAAQLVRLLDSPRWQADAVTALERMPFEHTAGPVLAWWAVHGATVTEKFWFPSLVHALELSVGRRAGADVPELSFYSWLQARDVRALKLALSKGAPAETRVDGFTLLMHAVDRFFRDDARHSARWLELAAALMTHGADPAQRLPDRFGAQPVWKKGRTVLQLLTDAKKWSARDSAALADVLSRRAAPSASRPG